MRFAISKGEIYLINWLVNLNKAQSDWVGYAESLREARAM